MGLLKQLLVQQLGLTEKSSQEDWPHFPRYRTASSGVQTDSGAQNSENSKAYPPGEGHMPFRTGTGDAAPCYSPRTSAESSTPRDSVVLAFQDSQASNILVMDHMLRTPEMPPAEPEGSLDESGEHFFDAREAHSDDNPSEGDGAVKKEEDVNLRISGKFLSHVNLDCGCYYLCCVLRQMLFGYPHMTRCVHVCAHVCACTCMCVCVALTFPCGK